jgi:SAM-dependent methyltransferase
MSDSLAERIRDYWESPETVSILDKNLHQLEIETVSKHLLSSDRLVDVGCGDGTATAAYAKYVRQVVGIERSAEMRSKAERSVSGLSNATIRAGDILDATGFGTEWDVAVTQRVLINLTSYEEQEAGIEAIHGCLKPGGRYIMIENTNEGFSVLNDARHLMGIPPVPQHWHNRFFAHSEIDRALAGRFQVLRHYHFGLYYLLTRVYANMVASFEGWGVQAKKDPIFEKLDDAARRLHEQFSAWFTPPEAFGPIQIWVLRKEESKRLRQI